MAVHLFRKQTIWYIYQLWSVTDPELHPGGGNILSSLVCFIGQRRLHYSENTSEKEMQVLWPVDVGLVGAEVANAQGCG